MFLFILFMAVDCTWNNFVYHLINKLMIVLFLKPWTFRLFIILALIIFPTLAYTAVIISDSKLILPNFDILRLVLIIILIYLKLSVIFFFLTIFSGCTFSGQIFKDSEVVHIMRIWILRHNAVIRGSFKINCKEKLFKMVN